jgi:HK97 family phage portal protein
MMLLANGQTVTPPALAELSPQLTDSYYYQQYLGLQLERNFAIYGEIYRKQPWVRTVIDKRAAALARLPVQCMYDGGETETVETDTGYAKLLADPCEYLDPFTFWSWVSTTIDIYGETYLAIQKDANGVPEKLMPMHPSRVAIKRNGKDGKYRYYFQTGSGVGTELLYFEDDEVVPFRLFNPVGLERGLSRMESLKETIFAEDASRNANNAMWRNGARPNLVLQHDKQLSEVAQTRLREQFTQAHAGSSNAGKVLVAEEGMKPVALQITAVEMQYIENRELNREEICGTYDVAPPMVHILARATFSNITAQMRAFYRDTMAVPIAFIESVMDKRVGQFWRRKNKMRFAVDDIIRGDWETRAESGQHAVTSGGMTPNEFRELLGLPRHDDPKADELFANSAMQPLGMPAEQIRLQGEISGATPDGVQATPMQTPVASLDQSKPTQVPKLPPRGSDSSTNSPTSGNPQPRRLMQPPKHLRAVKGALGRGQEIKAFAEHLAEKYPDDLEDILLAVQLALAERKDK